jgi:putative tricarboxylic transport membrane protein
VFLKNKNIQESFVIFICGALLLWYSLSLHYNGPTVLWKMSPSLFPVLVSVFLMLLSVSLFFDGLHQIKEEKTSENTSETAKGIRVRPVLITIALSIAYFVLMPYITFIPCTILFLGIFIFTLGEGRYWMIALVAVISALAIWAIFGLALGVRLP